MAQQVTLGPEYQLGNWNFRGATCTLSGKLILLSPSFSKIIENEAVSADLERHQQFTQV